MIYLITALDAEARPLIEHYRLKRIHDLPYPVYVGESVMLLVMGMGKTNALMALSALLGYRIPQQSDLLINIGICAAPKSYTIGDILIAHQIRDADRRYYPDILYSHPWHETSLICADAPVSEPAPFPVDMESAAVFQAASRFFKLHRLAFFKIVSDHFDPGSVSKEGVIDLVRSRLGDIDHLVALMNAIPSPAPLFTSEEEWTITEWKGHFTAAQGMQLGDALSYFRLRRPDASIPFPDSPIPNSKRERSALLEEFIARLTA